MTREAFATSCNVSRETLAKFDRYAELLVEWQGRMNLVGPSTLPDIWTRHFADSAQLLPLAKPGPWIDLGSGAGFPGIVVALLGAGSVRLVESTRKKCEFLTAVVEELGLTETVKIENARIEALPASPFTTISARACSALGQLFDWGGRFAQLDTRWLLMKGASVGGEIAEARLRFRFDAELVPSVTNGDARIVVASNVRAR